MQRTKSFILRIKQTLFYSQHFIFFVTYDLAQEATVLHNSKLEILVRDKRSCLLEPFIIYAKNEVLWIRTQGPMLSDFFVCNLRIFTIM